MSEVKYLKGVEKCRSQGKVYNRHSGRCVASNGRIGKAILAKDDAPVFLPVKIIKTLNLSPKKSPVRVSSPKKSPARVSSPKKSRKSKRVHKTLAEKAMECRKAGKMLNPKTGRCIDIAKKSPVRVSSPKKSPVRVSSPKKSPVRVSSPKKSPVRVAKTLAEKALECKKAGKMLNPKTGRCINISKRVSSPKKSRKSKRVSFRSVSSPKKSPVRVSSPKKSPVRVSSPKKSRKSKRVAKTLAEKALECKKAGKMLNTKTGRCINITKKNTARLGDNFSEYDQERLRRAFVARITDF